MPGKVRNGGLGLRGALDNDIYQAVAHLLRDPRNCPDVPALYQTIQRSNSSLKRKPKRVLEDSLERILDTVRADIDAMDDEAALDQPAPKQDATMEDANIMNRSIINSWQVALPVTTEPSTPATETNVIVTEGTKRREVDGQPPKKRTKTRNVDPATQPVPSNIRMDDLGGVGGVKRQLMGLLTLPLKRPEAYTRFNIPFPRGVLLHGPPGCGKSMLARATAAKLRVPFVEIMGPSVVSGMSGESEKQIRDRFDEARRVAPCLMFIDEIDVLAPKRENSQSQMEKRIVAQLLLSIDSLDTASTNGNAKPVVVLAATNRPDAIDPALRRGGRFDTEINMGVPNEPMREAILRALTKKMFVADDVDFTLLAKMTAGYVGADLSDLISKASNFVMQRYQTALCDQAADMTSMMDDQTPRSVLDDDNVDERWEALMERLEDATVPEPEGFENLVLPMEAFLKVLPEITPSSKREGFATIPDTTWDDIGALQNVREELQMAIVEPIKYPDLFASVGISGPTGVLLWGPPGCGKTLLAKAVANESKANFISVKGPELLNKYVGESERAVRTLFNRARSSAPCVIFFDELDALVPRRDDSLSEASARVVNTLLTEMDGLSERMGIYIIAATNRPDTIDEAMLRPGRLESPIYVGLPGAEERVEILKALVSKGKNPGVWPEGVEEVVRDEKCQGYSGADISSLLRQAGQQALRRRSPTVSLEDFQYATTVVQKSVANIDKYERMKKRFGAGRS